MAFFKLKPKAVSRFWFKVPDLGVFSAFSKVWVLRNVSFEEYSAEGP